VLLALAAKGLLRGRVGRSRMAIRDMESRLTSSASGQSAIDGLRRADRAFLDRRAEWSGAATGNRQGEAAALAIPVL